MLRYLLIMAAALSASAYASGQPSPAQRQHLIFGTFSSLRMHQETGDVLGAELTVVPQYNTAYVIFQCAEGVPTDPVFVSGKVKGDMVEFTVQQENSVCNGKYSATATKDGVKLSSDISPGTTEFLPRRRSYWAQ